MTTRLSFAGYQGEKSVHTRAGRIFCETIQGEAGDTALVSFDENIVLKGHRAAELLTKTESGEIDGCYFSSSYLAARVPELGLFDQHFVVPDRRSAYAVLDGALGQRLAQNVEDKTGFKVLGYWDNGLRNISNSHKPIRSPEDCMDLKIRTLDNKNHQRVFGALGFEPVKIDVRDLPHAVTSGTVDAQENPLTNTYNFEIHKTHKHITLTQHLLGVAVLLFNKDIVNSWSDTFRNTVYSAAAHATKQQRDFAEQEDTVCMQLLTDAGCKILELNADERAIFRQATEAEVAITRSQFDDELIALFEGDLASV